MIEKLADKIEDATIVAIVCVFIFMTSALIRPKRRAFKELIFSLIFSVPLGIIAGGVAQEFGYGFYTSLLFACVVTVFIHPLFVALVGENSFFTNEIKRGFTNLVNKYTK